VSSSQLNYGWWVQILCTISSASLSYTSYVQASSNLVVEYTNSYSITLSGYNSSRSIPTSISWLDNRYVLYFY
jgi:hypothetical protein